METKSREQSILEINKKSIGKKARVFDSSGGGFTGLIIDASVDAFLIDSGAEKNWISLFNIYEIS
jgi:hypothetical protein